MYCSQKLGEDFAKFCGLLRIYELYLRFFLIAGVMAVNGIGMGGEGDQAHLTDEERKAAALRVIRRAKRMALPGRDRAYSTCETGQFPQAIGGKQPPVPHKNSRKSRSGFGRGLPKKGKFQNRVVYNRAFSLRLQFCP